MPIWVADYVLMGYGTGAIMAVPAHDTRDFEFAVAYKLPIKAVVDPGRDTEEGTRADVLAGKAPVHRRRHGDQFGRLRRPADGRVQAEDHGRPGRHGAWAAAAVNYKLRDWLFSRQHFWGEPFPILHELDAEGHPTGLLRAVRPTSCRSNLPDMSHFKPHGRPEPPLEEAPQEWLYPVIDGRRYKRETNTMPQWAGSCWYYLRFLDPHNEQAFVDRRSRTRLDAGRHLHRRSRARRAAPALFAVLAQSAL